MDKETQNIELRITQMEQKLNEAIIEAQSKLIDLILEEPKTFFV